MAQILHRLGRLCARHRFVTVAAWVVLLALAAGGAATLSGPTKDSFSIPGVESTRALQQLDQEFPSMAASGAEAKVVFQAPSGEAVTDPQNAALVKQAVQRLEDVDGVVSVTSPLNPQAPRVSPNHRIGLATVTFSSGEGAVSPEAVHAVEDIATDTQQAGLRTEVGGSALEQPPEVLGPTELVGVAIAFGVLLLTYGSLVAAGANILTAGVGVGIGAATITTLTGFLDLQSTTSILAVMLGLAVGIDYALFIFARFRSELRDGHDLDEAAGRAVATAGSAVVFAGTTVVLALAGLSVVGIPFLTQMGLAASGTVVVAVLVALTLVPALLRILGRRVLGGGERQAATARHRSRAGRRTRPGLLARWAGGVSSHPVASLVAAVAALVTLAVPVASLQTALPTAGDAAPSTSKRQAYDLISSGFGPGANGPLLLLVQGENAPAAAAQVSQAVSGMDNVARVAPAVVNPDRSAAMVTVIPGTGPTDPQTTQLVSAIRSATDDPAEVDGAQVSVTGHTAVNVDVDHKLSQALPVYLALIVGLALVLLLWMFRSLFVPVLATIGFLLSFGAGLGAAVATYQWGWLSSVFGVAQTAPLMSLLPIITVGILFGLAMDYQVFLVSRMREAYVHGAGATDAVVAGFRRSAPVVVAAATIMAAVFAGFIGSDNPMVGSIAVTLAVGVLADAFIVRMVVMPAVLVLAGRGAWWLPRWLARVLPHVDVEGKALQRPVAGTQPTPQADGDRVPVGAGDQAG